MRMRRPRGTGAGAAAAARPAMNIVRGCADGRVGARGRRADAGAAGAAEREPRLDACGRRSGTGSSAPGRAHRRPRRSGARAPASGRHPGSRQAAAGPAERVRRQLKRRPAPASWANHSRGCRPWAFGAAPELPQLAGAAVVGHRGRCPPIGGGGSTVRAVSMGRHCRDSRLGSGRGRPAELISAAETELVVVLVFFAAAVTGDQMRPPENLTATNTPTGQRQRHRNLVRIR